MKKFVFFLLVLLLTLSYLAGQEKNTTDDDKAAIARAALDYCEGYYEGDAARMERALSPNLTKRGLVFAPRAGASYLQQMNAAALVEATRSGRGKLPAESRQIDYRQLDQNGSTAAVRVFSARFNDYLHLIRQNGQWRIVNVLWRLPVEKGAVNPEGEKETVRMALEEFREALSRGNYERVENILHPALVIHVLSDTPGAAGTLLQERNADFFIERARAGVMSAIPDFRISVQDVYEDIAAAKVVMGNTILHLHLCRQNQGWRIINMLQGQLAPPSLAVEPATLGQQLAAFTLDSVQGKTVSLAGLQGKNVLLVFPRGRVGDHWCQICHYQYAELAELDKRLQLRKKYDLEILFVLPYDRATVEHWLAIFPEQMAVIEKWKNPGDPAQISPGEKRWMEISRLHFPKKFSFTKGNISDPFPILIDNERTLSRGLDLFTLLWDNSRVEQNIPAVYLLDRHAKVLFKYLSQNTMDRPDGGQLLEILKRYLKP